MLRLSLFVFLLLSALAPRAWAQAATPQPPSGPPPVNTPAFVIQSDNGDNRLQVGGFLQMEGRFALNDDQRRVTNTFTMRRFRLILQGRLARHFEYYWNLDFAGNVLTLRDAYFDTVFSRALHVRVGKMKAPFSYDRLLLVSQTLFIERGMSTSVAPDRDTGVQVFGDLAGGVVSYAGHVGNGTADGQLSELDTNENKDVVGRVMIKPWARNPKSAVANFAFGGVGSTGLQAGPVPIFLSPGRQQFFSYASGAVGEDRRNRWSPQAVYFHGPFWGYAEYVRSQGAIRRGDARASVAHDSWQVAGSWVLTGESVNERNVRPRVNFDPPSGHWGAVQLVARYQELHVSRNAFDLGLTAAGASRSAQSFLVGANWYLNPLVKWSLNFERTVFDGSATAARQPENALMFQAQFSL